MNKLNKILIIEDEPQIRKVIRSNFTDQGIKVLESYLGEEGIRIHASDPVELIILDIGLPDISGIEVARRIREWSAVPIIILSASGQERDKIDALDAGADDYLTKPFSMAELQARIRAVTRRLGSSGVEQTFYKFGNIEVDVQSYKVIRAGIEVHLTPKEFAFLLILLKNINKIVTQKFIINSLWGANHEKDTHYLRIIMKNLRSKLEEDPTRPRFLITELGVGYRFVE